MSVRVRRSTGEATFGTLVRLYPAAFRTEFGGELLHTYRALRLERRYRGWIGAVRLWLFLLRDLTPSIARERAAELRGKSVPLPGSAAIKRPPAPPYLDALLAGFAVFALYVATLAPTVAFWDTGEYMTAAHVLGIPHAPGNPLFVLLAHGWDLLLSPLGLPVAVRMNLFSATCSAAAHACWFLVIDRSLRGFSDNAVMRRVTAAAAVLLSATAFTVWNQSNVNEKVYTLSLFTTALVSWLLLRWRDCGRSVPRLLAIVFLISLSSTNHLMGALVAPAALLFVCMVDRRAVLRWKVLAPAVLVAGVGLLPQLFLPLPRQPAAGAGRSRTVLRVDGAGSCERLQLGQDRLPGALLGTAPRTVRQAAHHDGSDCPPRNAESARRTTVRLSGRELVAVP
jgi:hypothetical protein